MSSTNSTALLADYLSESRVPQSLVVIILCPVIALCCVNLRLYTRAFLLKRVFWEDYLIVAAMISILLHYTRLSVMALERRLCHVLFVIVVLGYSAMLILSLTRCIPFQAIWMPQIPGANCTNTTTLFLTVQGHSLAMDFIILVAPLFILRHLTIPWPQRVLLIIVVGFGGIACIAGVLRLQVLRLSTTSPDKTWDSFFSAIYGAIEVNLGIACACIVTLRPLFRRWLPGTDEQPQVELEQPRPRRHVVTKDHIPTMDSTLAATTSNDVELALDKNGIAAPSVSERETICASFPTQDKDDISAGSASACSTSSEGRQDSDINGSVPK
ncbi:hypothetical protein B0T26DRAFT_646280 [Lasiosphaeria miniovina]|uniref:Rhodopsin domain-containing protein n=1 Tax=Lasiosphaeria miniovina TaxID=1954250 RepID=A0AA40AKF7_9PEZI|nr:uncharacterized protein B0T26DRAFT_646280 [Lasiosphaeria miniovina]KAK0717449.1 hypothetical protein B0T26DRAFT_646280 [Lasiosphaeria miniovina]